jgi:hypothetical protein
MSEEQSELIGNGAELQKVTQEITLFCDTFTNLVDLVAHFLTITVD